ncbi:MAG: hypothetical protein WC292_01400 [Clostridia bacterium]
MSNNGFDYEKTLLLARAARSEKNAEDTKHFYDLIRMEDPNNAEAKFFHAYYRLLDGTKGGIEIAYKDFCNAMTPIIGLIAKSSDTLTEKAELLAIIFDKIKGLPSFVNRIQNDIKASAIYTCRLSITTLYAFGDEIEKFFSSHTSIMDTAVKAWKDGVYWQQQWYGVGVDKSFLQKYVAKIRKIDPSFTLPKKGGCIQVSKEVNVE